MYLYQEQDNGRHLVLMLQERLLRVQGDGTSLTYVDFAQSTYLLERPCFPHDIYLHQHSPCKVNAPEQANYSTA
jgi:hypothetical protein